MPWKAADASDMLAHELLPNVLFCRQWQSDDCPPHKLASIDHTLRFIRFALRLAVLPSRSFCICVFLTWRHQQYIQKVRRYAEVCFDSPVRRSHTAAAGCLLCGEVAR